MISAAIIFILTVACLFLIIALMRKDRELRQIHFKLCSLAHYLKTKHYPEHRDFTIGEGTLFVIEQIDNMTSCLTRKPSVTWGGTIGCPTSTGVDKPAPRV